MKSGKGANAPCNNLFPLSGLPCLPFIQRDAQVPFKGLTCAVPPAPAVVPLWGVPQWKHFKSFKWQLLLPVALSVEIKCSTELICQTTLTWKPNVTWFFNFFFCESAAVKILQHVFFLKSFFYDPQIESTTCFFLSLVPGWSQQTAGVSPRVTCSGNQPMCDPLPFCICVRGFFKFLHLLPLNNNSCHLRSLASSFAKTFFHYFMKSNSNTFLKEAIYKVIKEWTNICITDFSIII